MYHRHSEGIIGIDGRAVATVVRQMESYDWPMNRITAIQSDEVPRFVLHGQAVHGSQAMLVDCGAVSMLYTSGQVAPSGAAGRGDITDQVHAVMSQLRALTVAAGGGLEHVVKLTAWLPRRADVVVYASVRRQYLDPPRTGQHLG
jgi:enamine deaminase RidA (YjgF/YER057c/UK114 family)